MDIINFVIGLIFSCITLIFKYYIVVASVFALRWLVLFFFNGYPALLLGAIGIGLWDNKHDNIGLIVICTGAYYQVRWIRYMAEHYPNPNENLPILLWLDKVALAMARLPVGVLDALAAHGIFDWRKFFTVEEGSSWRSDDTAEADAAWREAQNRQRQQEQRDERQQRSSAGGGQGGSSGRGYAPPPPDDYAAAVQLLGLREPFSKEELAKAYRDKVKTLHPDKWESLPPHIKQQLDDQLKGFNVARDIINKRRGWK